MLNSSIESNCRGGHSISTVTPESIHPEVEEGRAVAADACGQGLEMVGPGAATCEVPPEFQGPVGPSPESWRAPGTLAGKFALLGRKRR